ncbi:hypothetical protein K490DRAFT_62370 [Saccharata proteae CBS 121410]|uniref:Telomeric single stranded DNA binding POT1/Cdc13 domain-containing protein n=1 Tax=Saccharata proteae CBS 121410 TaxID=1314787 RepID=A0A9P4I1Y1_9PEZI|nr:hypothetical protein K490DRAFT_62370 [Saccharata proteae CBS 121410]
MEPPAPATEAIPISTLQPQLPAPATKSISAVVTLLWPYSSVHRSCALLLAEPDFRLRRRRGQVRVVFSGHASQAIATSGIGIGDDVQLSLDGVQWRTVGDEETVRTPGKSVEWELLFTNRLRMRVVRDGSELASLEINHEATPEPEEARRTPEAALRTPAPIVGRLSGDILHGREAWTSPAFVKRARLSLDSLFKPTFDPFADLDNESEERSRKRRRRSFREIGVWTYAARTPSPEKEDASLIGVVKEGGANGDQNNDPVRMPETPESAETPVAEARDDALVHVELVHEDLIHEELVHDEILSRAAEADADKTEKLQRQAPAPLAEQKENAVQSEVSSGGKGILQAYQELEDAIDSQFLHEATQDTDMMGGDTEENTEVDEHDEEPEDDIPGYSLKEVEMLEGDRAEPTRRPFEIPDTFDMSPTQLLAQEQDQEYAGDTEPDSDADVIAEIEDHGEMTPTEMDSDEEEDTITPPEPSRGEAADHSETNTRPHGLGTSPSGEAKDDDSGRDAGEKLDIPVMGWPTMEHNDHTPESLALHQAGVEGLPAPTMPPPPLLSLRTESSQASQTPSLAPSLSKEADAPITPLLQPVTSASLPLPSPFPGASDAPPPMYQHSQTRGSDHEEHKRDDDKHVREEDSLVAQSAVPATVGQDAFRTSIGQEVFRTSGFWGMVQEDVEAAAEDNEAHADNQGMSDDMFDDDQLHKRFNFGLDGSRSMTAGQPSQAATSPESHEDQQVIDTAASKREGATKEITAAADDRAIEVSGDQESDGERSGSFQGVTGDAEAEIQEPQILAASAVTQDGGTPTKPSALLQAQFDRDTQDAVMTETMNAAESASENQQRPMAKYSSHEFQPASGESKVLVLKIDPALLKDSSLTAAETSDQKEEDFPNARGAMSSPPKSELGHRQSSVQEPPSSPTQEQPYTWGQQTYEPSFQPNISSPPHPKSDHESVPSVRSDDGAESDVEMQDAASTDEAAAVSTNARDNQRMEKSTPGIIVAKPASHVDIVDLGSGSGSESDEEMPLVLDTTSSDTRMDADDLGETKAALNVEADAEEMPYVPDAATPESQMEAADIGETEAAQNMDTSGPIESKDHDVEADMGAKPQKAPVEPMHEEVSTGLENSAPIEPEDNHVKADMDAEPQGDTLKTMHEQLGTDEAMKDSSFYVLSSSPLPPPRSPSPIEHLDLSQIETDYMPYTLSQSYSQASQRFSQQVPNYTQQHAAAWRWRKEVKDSEDSIDSGASISTIRESSPIDDGHALVPEDVTWQKPLTKIISPEGGNAIAGAAQHEEGESQLANDKIIDPPSTVKPVRPPPLIPTHSSMLQNDSSMIREIMEQQSYMSQQQENLLPTSPLQESAQSDGSPTQGPSPIIPTHSSMMVDDSSLIRDMRTQPVRSPSPTQERHTSPATQILKSQVDGTASPPQSVQFPSGTQKRYTSPSTQALKSQVDGTVSPPLPTYPDLPSEVAETENSATVSQAHLSEKSKAQVDPENLHFAAHESHVPVTPDPSTQVKETQSEVHIEEDTAQGKAALLLTPGFSQSTTYIDDRSQASFQLPALHPNIERQANEESAVGGAEAAKPEDKEQVNGRLEPRLLPMPAKDLERPGTDEGMEDTLNGSTVVDIEPSAKADTRPVKSLSSPPHTQSSQGYRTSLSYYTPLANLSAYLNSQSSNIDILAVCTRGSKPATRAEKGPRDYNTIFHITDPSLTETAIFQPSIAAQIFRPFKTALPVVERGDIVLLRGFVPKSRNGKVGLLSGDESGWCVWRYGKGDQKAQQGNGNAEAESKKRLSVGKPIWADQTVGLWGDATSGGWGEVKDRGYPREEYNGPPVEVGEEEREEAKRLRNWWGESDDEDDI